MYSAYVFSSRYLTVNVPPCSLSLISGQYWAHLFYRKYHNKMYVTPSSHKELYTTSYSLPVCLNKQWFVQKYKHVYLLSICFWNSPRNHLCSACTNARKIITICVNITFKKIVIQSPLMHNIFVIKHANIFDFEPLFLP